MGCGAAQDQPLEIESEEKPQEIEMPYNSSANGDAPDIVEPVLPKLTIHEPRMKIIKDQHDLLTEDPELLDFPDKMHVCPEQMEQVDNLPHHAPPVPIKISSPPEAVELSAVPHKSVENEAEEDGNGQQKRRVKKIIRERKTAEYEFNDNEDAEEVTVKTKGVFDQIERDQLEEIKHEALERPGSADIRKNDRTDADVE